MPLLPLLLLLILQSPGISVTVPCKDSGHLCVEDDLGFASVEVKSVSACDAVLARTTAPVVMTLTFSKNFRAIRNESTNPLTAILVPVEKIEKGMKGRIIYCRRCKALHGMEVD